MVKTQLEDVQMMKDDPLHFVKFLMGFFDHNYVRTTRIAIGTVVLFLEAVNVMCIVEIFANKHWEHLARYLPFLLIEQPGCCGMLIVVFYSPQVIEAWDTLFEKFWAVESADTELSNKIFGESKMAIAMAVVNILVAGVTCISFWPFLGDEIQMNYVVVLGSKYFDGMTYMLFSFVFWFCILLSAYGVFCPILFGIYTFYQVRFQFYLLNEYLKVLSKDCLKDDTMDQETVYSRLAVCAKHHANVIWATRAMLKVQDIPLFLMNFTGSFAVVSAVYFVLWDVSPPSNFRMGLVLLIGTVMLLTACYTGQIMTDESERLFYTIYECPWVYWNSKNRKAVLTLLTNSLEPLKMTCFGLVDLNYAFGLYILRGIYSLVAVILNVDRAHQKPSSH